MSHDWERFAMKPGYHWKCSKCGRTLEMTNLSPPSRDEIFPLTRAEREFMLDGEHRTWYGRCDLLVLLGVLGS